MCGRFIVTRTRKQAAKDLPGVDTSEWLAPRYNVAPTQPVPVMLDARPDAVAWLRWGLIPHWAREITIGAGLINARAETLADKPAFRFSYEKRRCLILADGFYEWKKVPGSPRKVPHLIRMKDGRLFAFAGLWARWEGPERQIESCTIITTTPNACVAPIHDRMPVILAPADWSAWLAPGAPPRRLLGPCPAGDMEAVPVTDHVNSTRNDDAACIAPAV